MEDLIGRVLDAFGRELVVDGDPVQALRRLSETDAIRFLTIHKCKGLEFEKVVVLGVEEQLFWSNEPTAQESEFFVAISRAKQLLVLTHVMHRDGCVQGSGVRVRPDPGVCSGIGMVPA
ncbi:MULTISPECIES: 3'-5' exonuclease [Streptomyces]|uniref:3'-5' exonuclease n=1 Tax=Streptomyces TaxID=1883 RepID=UPI00210AAD57|nr:3'-5' exonuclease [Streptomyces sp. PAN_FS17]